MGGGGNSDYRILRGVGILFKLFVFNGLFFNLVGQLGHGEAGVNAAAVLLQGVVYELILLLK